MHDSSRPIPPPPIHFVFSKNALSLDELLADEQAFIDADLLANRAANAGMTHNDYRAAMTAPKGR